MNTEKEDPKKSREGIRNVFIYPEKQTPVERLAARVTRAVTPYVNEDTSDDDFDEMSLEIKKVGRVFLQEVKQEGLV